MRHQLTRIEVSILSGYAGHPEKFQRLLASRLPSLVSELSEVCQVTPSRIQIVANPKKKGS